jgi:uncharacterized protein (DUF302 family)
VGDRWARGSNEDTASAARLAGAGRNAQDPRLADGKENAMITTLAFEVPLSLAHEPAIARVTEALQAEGFGVLTRIDVKNTLKEKLGVEFRPYAILGACNPPLAHRALSHDPRVGLVLPCNVVVEQTPGGSLVRIGDPDAFMGIGDFVSDPELKEVAAEARRRLARVADALRAGA